MEGAWFDVLNHPPHHLTRWNLAAFRKLAAIVGVDMRYFAPAPQVFRQALQAFRLRKYGPHVKGSRWAVLGNLFEQAPQFMALWWRLMQRSRRHVLSGADSILIEFSRKT